MKSREGQHATTGHDSLSAAVAAECVDKLENYYLPWIRHALEAIDNDITWRRPRAGVNSIGNLLLHLNGNIRQWMVSGLGGASDDRDRDSEFAAEDEGDRWDHFDRLETTVHQACEVINRPRTNDEWITQVSIQDFATTPLSAVIHVVEHMSYHTGQIVMLAKSATGEDFKFYDL